MQRYIFANTPNFKFVPLTKGTQPNGREFLFYNNREISPLEVEILTFAQTSTPTLWTWA
jgi:hypothetical protein